MAQSINSVVIVGRLTRDVEIKTVGAGTTVATIPLAYSRSVKRGDAWEEESNYIDVTLWGNVGNALAPYLTKGKQIAVKGQLRYESWEKDGVKRSRHTIVADMTGGIQLLGNKNDGGGNGSPPAPKDDYVDTVASVFADDEVPF